MNNRESVKALIELSSSFEEADEIINKYTSLKTYEEKINYLSKTFNCEIFDRIIEDEYVDYVALLTCIVDKKWN